MRLTPRDIALLRLVEQYRVLRRDQAQRLLFPSKNTANERLKRLYQHRFLLRRWLPVEYGQGMGQALYLLDCAGADVLAQARGDDRSGIGWRRARNLVSSSFLQHTLMINDVRVAVTLAARQALYRLERWEGEDELAAKPDYVWVPTRRGRLRIAVIADSYFALHLGDRRAHFLLEADRATVSNKRWALRVRAYLQYVRGGQYARRFGTRSLRVLTVTTGERRLANLKRTTEKARGGTMFWFTTQDRATPSAVLSEPVWRVGGSDGLSQLIGNGSPCTRDT